jgi:hypothetical protein
LHLQSSPRCLCQPLFASIILKYVEFMVKGIFK